MIRERLMRTAGLASRLFLLLLGTLVGMLASVVILVGVAGRSLGWLGAGAVIMLLSLWLIERFYTKSNKKSP